MTKTLLNLVLFSAIFICPNTYGQGLSLFGPKYLKFTAPDKSFSINLPKDWRIEPSLNFYRIFNPRDLNTAITIHKIKKEKDIILKNYVLNEKNNRLLKRQGVSLLSHKSIMTKAGNAEIITIQYRFQGNAEYLRIQEEMYIESQNYFYILQFDSPIRLSRNYVANLNEMYNSFIPFNKIIVNEKPSENIPWVEPLQNSKNKSLKKRAKKKKKSKKL